MTSARHATQALEIRLGPEELVIRDRYEVASIVNDFAIAMWFAIGSAFFFFSSLETAGIWLFLIGSIQLGIRPVIRLSRRVHLRRRFGRERPRDHARDF